MDLLEGDALGHLATVRANGTPHVTPLWIDHDGDTVLVNVRVDRVKAANMRERPAVAISIVDPRNSYRYLALTEVVRPWTEDGWSHHMDKLNRRSMKVDPCPWSSPGARPPRSCYHHVGRCVTRRDPLVDDSDDQSRRLGRYHDRGSEVHRQWRGRPRERSASDCAVKRLSGDGQHKVERPEEIGGPVICADDRPC